LFYLKLLAKGQFAICSRDSYTAMALSLSGPDDRRSRDRTGRSEYIEKVDRTGSRPEVRHLVDEARGAKQFGNAFSKR
jgi:hypothetical protein